MGGMIAQIAASEYPERILSLTSIMSSSGENSKECNDAEHKEDRPSPGQEGQVKGDCCFSMCCPSQVPKVAF